MTSILFADLVGFTPFAEVLDPEDVRDFLSGYFDHCREIISRYGGTVEKFIGDAVMAVWGVPTVHEDDAERAVRAGLDLTEMIGTYGARIGADTLRLRVGIATGEVAVTLGAVGQGMVSGDAVNTASRVQARATPGEVWVDAQTVGLTSGAIHYESKGEHQLKGKAHPVLLHAATAVISMVGEGPLADHLNVPLAGYRREFAQVKETFHATVEERRGRLLLVVGEPGIGKTRLAQELQGYLDGLSTSIYWHWGQCVTYGEGIVYSALVHAVGNRIGIREADGDLVIQERIDQSLGQLGVSATDRAWLAPRLAVLLGVQAGPFTREDLFAAWLQWFETLGADGSPIIWVVEDAHHADDALLDFMEHLARSVDVSLLVLALARPDLFDRRPRFGSGRRASILNLDGLSDDAMGELIQALIENVEPGQKQQLIRQADGIPLYAIETVRAMLDRGTVKEGEPGRRVLAGPTPAGGSVSNMPASLQVLVSSRLDLLPSEDRSILQNAAVLGTVFERDDLRVLTDLDAPALDAALARLRYRDLIGTITDRFSPHAGAYTFVQSVVRQVAYDLLSRRDRIDRHVRVANHLMEQEVSGDRAAVVAQHLNDAIALTAEHDPHRSVLAEQRSRWLERAGDRARSVGAHGDALRLYELALQHIDDADARTELLLRAGETANAGGRFDAAIAHARAVTTGDPSAIARATAIEVRALRSAGLGAKSTLALQRFPTPESLAGITPAVASELAYLWVVAIFEDLSEGDARDWAEWSYRWATETRDPMRLADALSSFDLIYSFRRRIRGLATLFRQEAIRIGREHHLTVQLVRNLTNQAVDIQAFDLQVCLENNREAAQLMRQSGHADWTYVTAHNYCNALRLAGDWDECLRVEAERPQPEGDISPVEYCMVQISTLLIQRARGQTPQLDPAWHEVEGLTSPSPYYADFHQLMIGLIHLLRGDTERAASYAQLAAHGLFGHSGLIDDFMYVWPIALEWSVDAGQGDEARALLRLVEQEPDHLLPTFFHAALAAWRAIINARFPEPQVDASTIEHDFQVGIERLAAFGAVPDQARTQAALGSWLLRQRREAEAVEHLRAATATFERLGARRWIDEVDRVTSLAGNLSAS